MLSQVLIHLDGIAAQEGGLLFMTTNKFNLLDEALIRPGKSLVFDSPFEVVWMLLAVLGLLLATKLLKSYYTCFSHSF